MVYRFLLLSDEADNFQREIQINSDATFLDFHNVILKATGYDEKSFYSFFICGDEWNKHTEITQIEMDTSSEEDSFVMDDTRIEELVEDERQKLLYVFDPMTERAFYIELREIITGKDIREPLITKSSGEPPAQFVDFDHEVKTFTNDTDDNFYGDEDFNEEDLEGYEQIDNIEEY
ncbi:MAG: plasmid pRiA4b ORF-3 family protein [Tannerella sp.]|jgi:hypothetical protein|nr:plasmid pRiA4b ORF-3 family protein [Tannerella sp.]